MNVYMNGALNCYATLYIRYARLYIYIYIYIWLVNVWCILYIYIYTLRTIHAATLHIRQPFLLCLLSVLST